MPKNPFQRPQPINHTRNVPRHGKPVQALPKKGAAKATIATPAPALPPLEELLHSDKRS